MTNRLAYLVKGTVLAATLIPALATAQFSESYNFLKSVRDREGAKATEIISKPGTVIIDTRDPSTGETALHIVTKARDMTWLNFLLARKAKTDVRDNQGNTPLMIAAQLGFIEGAQLLIDQRASVDLANAGGETPLTLTAPQRGKKLCSDVHRMLGCDGAIVRDVEPAMTLGIKKLVQLPEG